MKKLIYFITFVNILFLQNVNAQTQSDTSDTYWEVVAPLPSSQDIDMRECLVGVSKDSLITEFVMNKGSYPYRVDSVYFTGDDASAFSQVSGFPKFIVNINSSKTVELRFNPSRVGLHQAKVHIITQTDTLIQNIIGIGISPTLQVLNNIIDFGIVNLKNYKDSIQAITIKNISSLPLVITETKHNYPNEIDFTTIKGGGSFTLAPNETKLMDLRFAPRDVGRTSGTLEFYYNGVGSPAVVQLFGEGIKTYPQIQSSITPINDLICESESIIKIDVRNEGVEDLIISSLNLNGTDNLDFTYNQSLPIVIKPDSSINLPIIFRPLSSGQKIANMEIKSNSEIDSVLIINLAGNKEIVKLSVVPSIDLGILCPNETRVFDVIIDNIGTMVTSTTLSGDSEIQISNPNVNILSGSQSVVTCEFLGISQEGSFNRVIRIQDTCGNNYDVNINGVIETPKLSIADITLNTVVGKSITQKINIANYSNRDVTINSLTGLKAPFVLLGNPFPLNVLSKSTEEVEIEFTPTDENQIIQNLSVIGEPCNFISNFDLIGSGNLSFINLSTTSIEAYTGDIIEVPIRLNTSQNLQLAGIISINAELYFNPTLLYPLEYSPQIVDDTTAFVKLENLNIIDTMNVELTKVKFMVGLGNRIDCALTLQNIKTIGGSANILLNNGNFKILGVCYDGGVRLLNPNSVVSMANISPNPVNSIISIDLNLIEVGKTEVAIYNLMGEKVKTIFSKEITETGSISINSDLSDLSNGQYIVIFKTPTYLEKNNILLLK